MRTVTAYNLQTKDIRLMFLPTDKTTTVDSRYLKIEGTL